MTIDCCDIAVRLRATAKSRREDWHVKKCDGRAAVAGAWLADPLQPNCGRKASVCLSHSRHSTLRHHTLREEDLRGYSIWQAGMESWSA
nr:hypothetical protein CFP56_00860 [Quercus suber]